MSPDPTLIMALMSIMVLARGLLSLAMVTTTDLLLPTMVMVAPAMLPEASRALARDLLSPATTMALVLPTMATVPPAMLPEAPREPEDTITMARDLLSPAMATTMEATAISMSPDPTPIMVSVCITTSSSRMQFISKIKNKS